jgi:hypothetical protein
MHDYHHHHHHTTTNNINNNNKDTHTYIYIYIYISQPKKKGGTDLAAIVCGVNFIICSNAMVDRGPFFTFRASNFATVAGKLFNLASCLCTNGNASRGLYVIKLATCIHVTKKE